MNLNNEKYLNNLGTFNLKSNNVCENADTHAKKHNERKHDPRKFYTIILGQSFIMRYKFISDFP